MEGLDKCQKKEKEKEKYLLLGKLILQTVSLT